MANEAARQGKQANLDPSFVAKVLEQNISERMSRREKSRAAKSVKPAAPQPPQAQEPVKEQSTGSESMSGLGGTGTPRPPAMTEDERRKRAIEAMFGTR